MAGSWFDQFDSGLATNPEGIDRNLLQGPYMPGEPQYSMTGPSGPLDNSIAPVPTDTRMGPGGSISPSNPETAWMFNPDGSVKTKDPSAAGGQGSGDPEAFRAAWFASPYPKTTDGLKQFVAANPQFGATITGSKGSKILIGGQAFQAVRSAGLNGGIGPAWDPLGAEGGWGAGGGSLGSLGGGFGSYVTPWDKPFQARDPNQIANDPAYQFQLGEGKRAVQSSAASRGTLLTGGTLKALDRFGQGLASTYNDKYYGRDMGEYLLGRENFYNNQDRPFSKNFQLATLGKPS